MRSVRLFALLLAVPSCAGAKPAIGWRGAIVDVEVRETSGGLVVSLDRRQPSWRWMDNLDRCFYARPEMAVLVDGRRLKLHDPGGAVAGPMVSGFDTPGHCAPARFVLEAETSPPFTVEVVSGHKVRGRLRVNAQGRRVGCGGFGRCRVTL